MDNPWIAAVSALFLWWFSTGIILWRVRAADNGPSVQHLLSVILALPLLLAGAAGIVLTRDDASSTGAYLAFLSALAVWGWIELAFLSGIITGPNRRPCPPGVPLGDRFLRGVGTLAWHELLLVAALLLLWQVTDGASNPVGFWAFAVLFFSTPNS
jgi:putative photosynthetic complex assembly protein 2